MSYFDALLTLTLFLWFAAAAGFVVLVARFTWEYRQDRKARKARVDLTDQTWRAGR